MFVMHMFQSKNSWSRNKKQQQIKKDRCEENDLLVPARRAWRGSVQNVTTDDF